MAETLHDVDFTGISQCMAPIPDPRCKQGSQAYDQVVRYVVSLPPYLDSTAKWMHTLNQVTAFTDGYMSWTYYLKAG